MDVNRWLQLAANTFNALLCAANLAAGCLQLYAHHLVGGLLNFGELYR